MADWVVHASALGWYVSNFHCRYHNGKSVQHKHENHCRVSILSITRSAHRYHPLNGPPSRNQFQKVGDLTIVTILMLLNYWHHGFGGDQMFYRYSHWVDFHW